MKKRGQKRVVSKPTHYDHSTLLSEKRTHLSEKRTELSYERTFMSYLRTATTLILFGIAFLGISKAPGDFFYYASRISIGTGVVFLIVCIMRTVKHYHEIQQIKRFFEKMIHYKFKK